MTNIIIIIIIKISDPRLPLCNGRLRLGCHVSPTLTGSWPSLLESGRAGSVCTWGCLCHPCVLWVPTIGDAPASGLTMLTGITSSPAVITRPPGLGATTTSWRASLHSCPYSTRLDSTPTPRDKCYVADMFSRDMCVGTLRGVTVDVSTVHDFHGSADKPSLNGTLRHQDLDLALLRGARLASRLPACDRLHVWTHPWGVTPASLQPHRQEDLQLPRGPW